jgi:hypothetical protein
MANNPQPNDDVLDFIGGLRATTSRPASRATTT